MFVFILFFFNCRVFYRQNLPVDLNAGWKLNFPYKIYIYNLPPSLNSDIIKEIVKTDYIEKGMMTAAGLGREIYKIGKYDDMSVRDTYQYSLEVIIHQKLLNSPYRTKNPDEADLFYVPAYTALRCIVKDKECNSCLFNRYLSALVSFLQQQPFFKEKRPHFSTIGRIHREMADFDCPYLLYPLMKEITYLAIEKESVEEGGMNLLVNQAAQSLIVVPYPSYIHFTANTANVNGFGYQRSVFALLPYTQADDTSLAGKIAAQFNNSTTMSYGKYFQKNRHAQFDMIQVHTESKNHDVMIRKTLSWMTHSVFCLHPRGNSPTRRSFYDAVLSGCIPVLFIDKVIPYAFSSSLDYSKFSVAIKQSDILHGKKVVDILKSVSATVIKQLQTNLDLIAQRMQYSVQNSNVADAMDLILLEVSRIVVNDDEDKPKGDAASKSS